ncbi:MAG: restriction endonuclease subunit S [Bacteroidetes bacterium]|nr:restriction endonuclease subunit S [Bacteroidota bacterium]
MMRKTIFLKPENGSNERSFSIEMSKKEEKYIQTGIGMIPADWLVTRLGNICVKFTNGGTPSTKNTNFWNGKIPWITGADFGDQKISSIRRYISKDALKNSSTNLIPQGSLLIVTRTGVGKMTIAPFDVAISQDITGVEVNDRYITSDFLFRFLDYNKNRLSQLNQGTSISGITRDVLMDINIILPPLPEQRKIATILQTWDKAIAQTQKLIDAKEKLKKGLMQKLLTGEVRFKEFKKEKWIKLPLRDIVSEFIVPMRDKPVDLSGNIPWCRIEDFNGKYLYESKTRQGVSKGTVKEMNLKVYPIGTVLVSCSAYLGVCAITKTELVTNQTFIGLVPMKNVKDEFIYYQMSFNSKNLNKISSGTTIAYLSREEFEKFEISFTKNINEQDKIVRLLSMCDDEIIGLNSGLEKLRKQKEGLMQQLLSGKKRVKVK